MSGFKKFLLQGNLIDVAVAFVIGAAFGTVVTKFTELFTSLLPSAAANAFSNKTELGSFLNALIAFILVAAAIYFVVVRPMERMKGPEAITTKACTECTSDIPLAAKRCPMCTAPQAAA